MDMGLPSDARATITALLAESGPDPLPAEQALGLLRPLRDLDVADLGRLAYHALTGVAPAAEPVPPAEVLAGFPPFAAEVLMRAIVGPDHRRPTSQALLIVLDTVPASAWPTAGRPFVTLGDEEVEEVEDEQVVNEAPPTVETPVVEVVGATVEEALDETLDTAIDEAPTTVETPVVEVADSGPETVETPAVRPPMTAAELMASVATPTEEPTDRAPEARIDDRREAPAEPAVGEPEEAPAPIGRAALHQEFRDLLAPSREVPRFDPLTDPLPDVLGAPLRPRMTDPLTDPWEPESIPETTPEAAPVDVVEPAVEQAVEPEPVVLVQPEPVVPLAPEPEPEPELEPEPGPEPASIAPSAPRGMHEEFRNLVDPAFLAGGAATAPPTAPFELPAPRIEALEHSTAAGPDTAADADAPRTDTLTDVVAASTTAAVSTPTEVDRAPSAGEATEPASPAATDKDDRQQTLLLVALLIVIIVLGVLYATSRGATDDAANDDGPATPQGASLILLQPADVAV